MHWLQYDAFYAEVKRVAKPGAIIAARMNSLPVITTEIDKRLQDDFYQNTIGAYWHLEREYVEEKYSMIPFPFTEITCPEFYMEFAWGLPELEGYLNSWSAVQQFIKAKGFYPVDPFIEELAPFWQQKSMKVVFPIALRMGRIHK